MSRRSSIENRVTEIVSRYVDQLVSAVAAEIRRNVADEIKAYFAGANGATRGAARLGFAGRRRRKRILPCIAPGCRNPSKGPRFHYLCDKHLGASEKDYEAWRKAKKDKQASA